MCKAAPRNAARLKEFSERGYRRTHENRRIGSSTVKRAQIDRKMIEPRLATDAGRKSSPRGTSTVRGSQVGWRRSLFQLNHGK